MVRVYCIRKGHYKGCWGVTLFKRWSFRHDSFIDLESSSPYRFFRFEDMSKRSILQTTLGWWLLPPSHCSVDIFIYFFKYLLELLKGVSMYTCMTCELEFDLQDYVLGTDFVCPHCLVVIRNIDSEEIDPAQAGLISIVIYFFKYLFDS